MSPARSRIHAAHDGGKLRVRLNHTPRQSYPPARESGGIWQRDSIESLPRHFLPSNHGLRLFPTVIAMFHFSHAVCHAVLQFTEICRVQFYACISWFGAIFCTVFGVFAFLWTSIAAVTFRGDKHEHPCSKFF